MGIRKGPDVLSKHGARESRERVEEERRGREGSGVKNVKLSNNNLKNFSFLTVFTSHFFKGII